MADLQNDLLEKASDKAHDKVVRIFGHLYTGYSKAAIEEEIIVGENYYGKFFCGIKPRG